MVSLRYLKTPVAEKTVDGVGERKQPERPAGRLRAAPRAPAERSLEAGADSQDWTVWGGGAEREQISPNDFYPVQM